MRGEMEGGVFDDALESGRMGGVVSFDSQGITLTQHDGARSWQIGWHDVSVTEGGASGKMLFFKSQGTGVVIFTEARDALMHAQHASGPGYEAIWADVKAHASQRRLSEGGLWLLAIASVVLLIWGVVWASSDGVDYAIDILPTSVDRQLGESARESMSQFGEPVDDEAIRALCMSIFEVLKVHAPDDEGFDYRLEVLENEMPNAFAMPGGQMVLLTGLLELMDGPEEVAGVLAHELAHVYRRHSMRRLLQTAGLMTLGQIAIGDVTGAAAMLASAAGLAALQHYSREAEEDADLRGVELMHKAGIDPEYLAKSFLKLQAHHEARKQEEEASKESDTELQEATDTDEAIHDSEAGQEPGAFDLQETLESWMSSHPDIEVRIRTVREHAQELGPMPETYTFELDWSVIERMKLEKTETQEASP